MPESITVIGLDELRQRLRDPELVRQALRVFGSRAARTGKRYAQKDLQSGTGGASHGIVARADLRNEVIFVKSMLPLHRAVSIETGRSPGEEGPTIAELLRWLGTGHERKRRRKSSRTYTPEQIQRIREDAIKKRGAGGAGRLVQAQQIQANIRRRGTEGKHTFGELEILWTANIPRWLQEAGDRILKRLKKGQ